MSYKGALSDGWKFCSFTQSQKLDLALQKGLKGNNPTYNSRNVCHASVPRRFSSTCVTESIGTLDMTQSLSQQVPQHPHREMPTHAWLTAKAEWSSAPSSRASSLSLAPSSMLLEQHPKRGSILTSCGIGLNRLEGGRGAG